MMKASAPITFRLYLPVDYDQITSFFEIGEYLANTQLCRRNGHTFGLLSNQILKMMIS